jgi:hypothetical protein
VQPHPIQATDPERCERPLVLEPSELAPDSGAATVQGGEAVPRVDVADFYGVRVLGFAD